MFPASLASFLVLAFVVSATPTIKLTSVPFSRRITPETFRASLEVDKARTQYLRYGNANGHVYSDGALSLSTSIWDLAVNVTVGENPSTVYRLIVNTASANTWLGSVTPYKITKSSRDTGETVNVKYYGISGREYLDKVSLGNGLDIARQSIGVMTSTLGFNHEFDGVFDGVIGFGPVGLSRGSLKSGALIPTVMDNLYHGGKISANLFTLAFQPAAHLTEAEITLGKIDDSKHVGDISYVDITNIYPSSTQWGFEQSITYGSSAQPILASAAGVLDPSSIYIHLIYDALHRYMNYTGAVLDVIGVLTITADNYSKLESLFFNIGGTMYEFTPNAQIFPRAFNTAMGGLADRIYLIIAPLGLPIVTGPGIQFVLGNFWFQRFYTVFDAGQKRIGFAKTQYTYDTSN